jgi:hypothetical protein
MLEVIAKFVEWVFSLFASREYKEQQERLRQHDEQWRLRPRRPQATKKTGGSVDS